MERIARSLLRLAGIACIAAPVCVFAQGYPAKAVRVLVPFTAGSLPDRVVRLVVEKMNPALGQPVIVENRIGAGGRIAAEAAARAAPDGYTILLGTASTHVVSTYLVKNMPYDPFKDFTPISNAASPVNGVVASGSLPVNSIKELIDYARKNPGKIAYGSNGIGSSHHLRGELIKMAAGIDMLHVPFPGSNEVLTAILANQIQLSFTPPGAVLQYLPSGRLKLLAVAMPQRHAALPNVPTLAESLPGYESITDFFAFFGPAGLPRPIVLRLSGEIVKALNAPDVRAKLEAQSLLVVGSSPEELAALMKNESLVYAKVVKAVGIRPE